MAEDDGNHDEGRTDNSDMFSLPERRAAMTKYNLSEASVLSEHRNRAFLLPEFYNPEFDGYAATVKKKYKSF